MLLVFFFFIGVFFDRTPTTASAGGRFGNQQLFDQLDLTDIQPFVAGGQRKYVFAVVVACAYITCKTRGRFRRLIITIVNSIIISGATRKDDLEPFSVYFGYSL